MAIAIDPAHERPYILKEEQSLPKHEQTIWWLRPLDEEAWVKVTNYMHFTATGAQINEVASQAVDSILYGLVRVENFRDAHGHMVNLPPIHPKNIGARREFIRRMKPAWRIEIGAAVREEMDVTEEQEKNFDTPSSSVSTGRAANGKLTDSAESA